MAALSPLLIRSGSKPNWASVSAPSARAGVTTGKATACSPALSARRQGSVVRIRRPRPPHPKIFCRNHHPFRLGRQHTTTRMDGRGGRKRSDLALRARHVRACRQAGCQRRVLLHRVRLPRHAHASLRQAGRQGVGTGAGHLRATAETPVCVHSIQVPRSV